MGAKLTKGNKDVGGKKEKVPAKAAAPPKLTDKDIKFLMKTTAMKKEEVNSLFQKFIKNNPDGMMNRDEFSKIYPSLRTELFDNLDEITVLIFRAFDKDNNGYLTFNEFLVGYALTTKGEIKQKLEYAFDLYDADNNGFVTPDEVAEVIPAMLDLLDTGKTKADVKAITNEIMKALDTSHNGKISKDEFINGLERNYNFRMLMSPFN